MELKYIDSVVDGQIFLEDLIVGQLLRVKRKKAAVTLEELSKDSGISKSHLAAMETIGKRPGERGTVKTIQRPTLVKALNALGVDYRRFKQEVDSIFEIESPVVDRLRQKKKRSHKPECSKSTSEALPC